VGVNVSVPSGFNETLPPVTTTGEPAEIGVPLTSATVSGKALGSASLVSTGMTAGVPAAVANVSFAGAGGA